MSAFMSVTLSLSCILLSYLLLTSPTYCGLN